MRAVIIHDEMQIEFSGSGLFNGLQKSDKFLTPVSGQALPDDRAIKHVEGGKERRGPMPFVIMRHRAAASPLQRQARLRTIQCLDLTFFIHRQHQGPFGRLQVQPDNIPKLFDKPFVCGDFEGLHPMRLQPVVLPDALNGHMRQSRLLRQRARTPMGRSLWLPMQGQLDHVLYLLI